MPESYYVSQYSGEEIDALLGGAGTGTVRYDVAQSLTNEQKAQARTNIGADTVQGAVRYDTTQTLADAQKKQARANIAAAPDGFGLGANGYPNPYTVVTGATIDTLNESGLFWFEDGDTPIYPDGYNSGTVGNLLHIHGDETHTLAARQIFYPYNPYGDGGALNISCMRMKTGAGEWQPWEWVNPPMQFGVEYRTTERYLGKPVYVKVVNCGNLPAPGSTKNVSHGISGCLPIMVTAQMSNSNTIPWLGKFTVGADNTNIVLYSPADASDFSGLTAMAILKYTKTTD